MQHTVTTHGEQDSAGGVEASQRASQGANHHHYYHNLRQPTHADASTQRPQYVRVYVEGRSGRGEPADDRTTAENRKNRRNDGRPQNGTRYRLQRIPCLSTQGCASLEPDVAEN